MIFVLLSTPTCAFIPKYHCLPFFVWCISGSRCCSRFLVEVGACRMVASTIVPVVIRTPCACKCRFTCPVPPVGVLPASAGTCTPWSRPAPAHSLDQCPRTAASPLSRTAPLPPPGPTGCTTAAKSKSAACALLPPAAAPSQAGDNAAPAARTTRPTAPPAPSPPEIWLAASSSCTAQSQSSSPGSSVSFLRHSNLIGCGTQRA